MERPTHVLISFLVVNLCPPLQVSPQWFQWAPLGATGSKIQCHRSGIQQISWVLESFWWHLTSYLDEEQDRLPFSDLTATPGHSFPLHHWIPSIHPSVIWSTYPHKACGGGAAAPPLLMPAYDDGISRDVYSHFVDIHWKTTKDGNNGEPNYMWIFFLKINSVAAFAMTLYLFALTRVWDLAELWELGWDLTAIQSWDDGLAVVSSPSCNRMFRIYRLELIFVFPRDSISIK